MVFFHISCYDWGKENRSLYRGLRYIEVRYIEVPLYFALWSSMSVILLILILLLLYDDDDDYSHKVSARDGELGIIPGSMGARSYIVRGKGNPESFHR